MRTSTADRLLKNTAAMKSIDYRQCSLSILSWFTQRLRQTSDTTASCISFLRYVFQHAHINLHSLLDQSLLGTKRLNSSMRLVVQQTCVEMFHANEGKCISSPTGMVSVDGTGTLLPAVDFSSSDLNS